MPVIRSLERTWPGCRITWILGRLEAKLMSLLPEIEFLTVDKNRFGSEFLRLRSKLRGRRFDLLLHMQVSLRASLLSTLVRAPVKLGFDRARARELQWLFTNRQIAPRRSQHVLDSFFGFAEAVGVADHRLEWNLPLPPEAVAYAERVIPDARPTLLISPCSSHATAQLATRVTTRRSPIMRRAAGACGWFCAAVRAASSARWAIASWR